MAGVSVACCPAPLINEEFTLFLLSFDLGLFLYVSMQSITYAAPHHSVRDALADARTFGFLPIGSVAVRLDAHLTILARLDFLPARVNHSLTLLSILRPEDENDNATEKDEEAKKGKNIPPELDIFKAI